MADYISLAERGRRRLLRNLGLGTILLLYGGAAAGAAFGGPMVRWSLIALAIVVPPLLERLLPKPVSRDGTEAGSPRLVLLPAASLCIAIGAAAIFGSDTVREVLAWSAGALGLLAALVGIGRWVIDEAGDARRRILILLLFAFCAALLTGALTGPPVMRWMCIGVAGAIIVAMFGPNPRPATNGWRGETYGDLDPADAMPWSRSVRPAWSAERMPIAVDAELRPLDALLRAAQREIEDILRSDTRHGPPQVDQSAMSLAIAALNNIDYIDPGQARLFNDAVEWARAGGADQGVQTRAIHLLGHEIAYARDRLRAHAAGARDPALARTR